MEDFEVKNNEEFMELVRFIGRNHRYVRGAMREEMIASWGKTMMVYPLRSEKDEKGRVIATTRMLHYSNAAIIAWKIALKLSGDKDFASGVSLCALLHDIGQPPFGHNGEYAQKIASENNNGGPMLHNIEGARKIIHRHADKIKYALNSGRIIEEEAKKRGIDKKELKRRIEAGLEPGLSLMIQQETLKNGNLPQRAVQLIAMSAGNHNGERGNANIKPNINRNFDEFWAIAKRTYIDVKADRQMEPCNIVDAIVKISDQISSIPFDVIDAKRAGIEDDISEVWAEPIAKILHITEEEAISRLRGNNDELKKMALELQNEMIESVVRCSSLDKIEMDLAPLLYGQTDSKRQVLVNGLRTPNFEEHTHYTGTAEGEVTLNNLVCDLTDKLATTILDENSVFPPELNEIFRLPSNSPVRRVKQRALMHKFNNEQLEEFYSYVLETSPEEYEFDKEIVKKREVQYYRAIIEKVLERREDILEGIETRSPRNSTPWLIEEYVLSNSYIAPEGDGNYTDKEIKKMLDRINVFLASKPIEGIKHLSPLIEKRRFELFYDNDKPISVKGHDGFSVVSTDRQIASRIALGYMGELSDEQLVNFAYSLGVITEEQRKIFTDRPYIKHSGKRTGKGGHNMKNTEYTLEAYQDGSSVTK